jgi:YgiT-type zinc finger domain-containing protein
MICLICRQADLVDGPTSAEFKRGEARFTVTSIPARVCPNCGDALVDENVALQLLKAVEDLVQSGHLEGIREYRQLQQE